MAQPDKQVAPSIASLLIKDYENRFTEVILYLKNALYDSLQFYESQEIDNRRISFTIVVERTIQEIRHRSQVIVVFPNQGSYVRLIISYLVEYSED